jgi:hypothetical protein
MGASVFCQYNAFGARPSRGLVNVGVGLMAMRQGQFVDGREKKARYVRYAPNSDRPHVSFRIVAKCRYQHFSLDHLVGAGDERPGNFKPKLLGGAEVDEQFDFGGLLDINLTRCLKANPAPRNRSARRGLGELGIGARVSPSPFHRANQAALYHQTGSSSACSVGR